MGSSDWFELETLDGEIARSRTRLAVARKTQNHGLFKLLQWEIVEAEKWRSRFLGHIITQLGSADAARHPAQAAPWNVQAHKAIERLKRELGSRRAEILARHAEELKDLEADQAVIDAFEQAINAFARRFKVAGSEVVAAPFEGGRGVA